jgi:hypothetical protein
MSGRESARAGNPSDQVPRAERNHAHGDVGADEVPAGCRCMTKTSRKPLASSSGRGTRRPNGHGGNPTLLCPGRRACQLVVPRFRCRRATHRDRLDQLCDRPLGAFSRDPLLALWSEGARLAVANLFSGGPLLCHRVLWRRAARPSRPGTGCPSVSWFW